MNQPVPNELISAYFDGEVTPEERREVERLLESAPDFRQQLDDTSKLSALLHSFPREAVPPELAANVQKQLQNTVPMLVARISTDGRSLRREWTAFGVGILATMASLLMFVRLNRYEENPHSWNDGESIVSEVPPKSESRSKPVGGVEIARTESESPLTWDIAPAKQEQESIRLPISPLPSGGTDLSKDGPAASQPAQMANFSDHDFNALQTQIQDDFLEKLTNGDVIVPKVADLENTVAVVGFIVVDMVRDTDDLKVLLLKRSVKQLESRDDTALALRKGKKDNRESKESTDKKIARSDDLQVFFVRAPGDQLAGVIDEYRKNHPDLNWAPQMPIELAQGSVRQEAVRLTEESKIPDADTKLYDSVEDPNAVAAEAELAFDALLARNSLVNFNEETSLNSQTVDSASKSKQDGLANRMRRSTYSALPVNQPVPNFSNPSSQKANEGLPANGNGYFLFTDQNSSQFAQQSPAAGPNSAVSLLANSFPNTNVSNGLGTGGNYRYSQSVSNSESRNSRPVKMLIMLQSQQPASSRSP